MKRVLLSALVFVSCSPMPAAKPRVEFIPEPIHRPIEDLRPIVAVRPSPTPEATPDMNACEVEAERLKGDVEYYRNLWLETKDCDCSCEAEEIARR